jgi:imidazolonepropionase-like amidohydrolase
MTHRRRVRSLVMLGLATGTLLLVASQVLRTGRTSIVFAGARMYASPTDAAIDDAVVVVRNGQIVELSTRRAYRVPLGATVVDCTGLVVTAGFWNSHVHFIDREWERAASTPATVLTQQLQRMLIRHGFTTVLDTGSDWPITNALRQRIERGEVVGPRILTTGEILFPKGGAPAAALTNALGIIPGKMAEVGTREAATIVAREKLDAGADALKVYAATWWNEPPTRLTAATVRTIAAEAHRRGKPLLAHPSDLRGIETAIEGGVDILAHTTAAAGPWPQSLVERMRQHRLALIPTLKLWRAEFTREGVPETDARAIQQVAVGQLRAYVEGGGEILFGTDVGYMQDDDPVEEYELMARAGMDFRQILASLSTAPAARFGDARHTGRIAPGQRADLVFLSADPAQDVRALAQVARVVRDGRFVFSRVQ